jgi:formate--tetrahydrofolate ligase
VEVAAVGQENVAAVERGVVNLQRHIENVRDRYGIACVVAINHRSEDTDAEVRAVVERTAHLGVKVILARHFAQGGRGAVDVAHEVVRLCDTPSNFKFVYEESAPLWEKMRAIATSIYGAADISASTQGAAQINRLQEAGYGHYPVCVAKTQYSFSTDPSLRGAPSGHIVNVREVRLAAGAQFVVMICGDIMTMPGLPRVPSANSIDVDANGKVVGLF